MRFLFLFLTVLFIQCEQVQDQPKQPQEPPFGIVIHGEQDHFKREHDPRIGKGIPQGVS